MLVRTSILIGRPPEQVWPYLEGDRELEWRARTLKRLKQTPSGAAPVGTRYEGAVAMGPGAFPHVNELTAYDPPHRLAWKAISSAG